LPDKRTYNHIDHVLISKLHVSNIIYVRSVCEAHCDSDHHLVKVKCRARINMLKNTGKSRITKINTKGLKQMKLGKNFKQI
jgi:hypothetical protein